MTVIAVRNRIMASDTMTGYGNKKVNEIKTVAKDGFILGAAGAEVPSMDDIVDWFFKVQYPLPAYENTDFTLLVLTPSGRIETWDHTGMKNIIKSSFWAIGAGADFAMGAMHAGADAETAVRLAIKHCWGCGGRVTTRSLED